MKKLLKAGCQPYFQMLEKWLAEGILDDPFQEFMVCCDMVSCYVRQIPLCLARREAGQWVSLGLCSMDSVIS